MDSKQFKAAAESVIDEITTYFDTIDSRRVLSAVEPGYLKKLLPTSAPEHGESWDSIQADIESKIVPGLTHWQSPKFMAFFPATTSYPSILGELYSATLSAPAFNWICSPAITELETIVMDWLCQALHLPICYLSNPPPSSNTTTSGVTSESSSISAPSPPLGGGVIQGSASEAIVTAMIAARDLYLRRATAHLAPDSPEAEDLTATLRCKLVALGSEQSHSSTQKAAKIVGVRYRSVPVGATEGFSMRGEAATKRVRELSEEGLVVFWLTVTLGTTSTCAVDDFGSIVQAMDGLGAGPRDYEEEVKEKTKDVSTEGKETLPNGAADKKNLPEIWVHVDAAYAGGALLCPEFAHYATHFAHFHSFNFNMHKWLLTNFDASCLFVRRRRDLVNALSITPSYLRNQYSEGGEVIDYRDWQIPLGRRFRSLKIWFVIRSYGIEGLRDLVRRHVKLGKTWEEMVKGRADLFKVVAGPEFGLLVFTVAPGADGKKDLELEEANRVTKEVYERVNKGGEIYITSTVLGGVYAIRVVSANERAEEKWVRMGFEVLVKVAEEVRAEGKGVVANRNGNGKLDVDEAPKGLDEAIMLRKGERV